MLVMKDLLLIPMIDHAQNVEMVFKQVAKNVMTQTLNPETDAAQLARKKLVGSAPARNLQNAEKGSVETSLLMLLRNVRTEIQSKTMAALYAELIVLGNAHQLSTNLAIKPHVETAILTDLNIVMTATIMMAMDVLTIASSKSLSN